MVFDDIRKSKGITKAFIVKELKISRGTLDNWIAGTTFPRLDQAVQLAKILNCKVDDLYKE